MDPRPSHHRRRTSASDMETPRKLIEQTAVGKGLCLPDCIGQIHRENTQKDSGCENAQKDSGWENAQKDSNQVGGGRRTPPKALTPTQLCTPNIRSSDLSCFSQPYNANGFCEGTGRWETKRAPFTNVLAMGLIILSPTKIGTSGFLSFPIFHLRRPLCLLWYILLGC